MQTSSLTAVHKPNDANVPKERSIPLVENHFAWPDTIPLPILPCLFLSSTVKPFSPALPPQKVRKIPANLPVRNRPGNSEETQYYAP
jgi:hypothetical protein